VGTVTTAASNTVPAGNVISESPVASTMVNPGSAVNLVVSTGPGQVSVPNVVGQTQAAATTAITNAGLVVGTVTMAASNTVPAGNVISESPVASTMVNPGSAVNLQVSTGSSATGPWLTGSGGAIFYTGGSVGIGTTNPNPAYPLHIVKNGTTGPVIGLQNTSGGSGNSAIEFSNANSSWYDFGTDGAGNGTHELIIYDSLNARVPLRIAGNGDVQLQPTLGGKVGIGTTAPLAPLHVRTGANENLVVEDMTWLYGSLIPGATGINVFNDANNAYAPFVMTAKQFVFTGGNVGIGQPNPVHELQVNGTIGAKQVIVSSTGADYVFQPGYELKPLAEVGEYIAQHQHLPDIPSAREMKDEGVDLGALQTKLLAKIEELTLHQIELEKANRTLQQQVLELRAKVDGTVPRPGDGK